MDSDEMLIETIQVYMDQLARRGILNTIIITMLDGSMRKIHGEDRSDGRPPSGEGAFFH